MATRCRRGGGATTLCRARASAHRRQPAPARRAPLLVGARLQVDGLAPRPGRAQATTRCWAGRRKKQRETSRQTLVGTTAAPANLHLIRWGSPLVSAALRSHHAVAAVPAALMRTLGPPLAAPWSVLLAYKRCRHAWQVGARAAGVQVHRRRIPPHADFFLLCPAPAHSRPLSLVELKAVRLQPGTGWEQVRGEPARQLKGACAARDPQNSRHVPPDPPPCAAPPLPSLHCPAFLPRSLPSTTRLLADHVLVRLLKVLGQDDVAVLAHRQHARLLRYR